MYESKILPLAEEPCRLSATLYLPRERDCSGYIVYLHGGGLLYGSREDLPEEHRRVFTDAGFCIAALDYPLAPAAKIPVILESVTREINLLTAGEDAPVPADRPYFLWGRSSGAYLALIAAASGKLLKSPAGILSYYGYGFLTDQWYETPAPWYQKLPPVHAQVLKSLPQQIHAAGSLETHYSAYVYARQTGTWKSLFFADREKYFLMDYSLRLCDVLPCPLFCAHSTGDPDVPYGEFLQLTRKYKAEKFLAFVSEHDFDRREDAPATKKLLRASVEFLTKLS